MTTETKQSIISQAISYMEANSLSQSQFAKLSQTNEAYLSNMINGIYTYTHSKSGEQLPIADSWFEKIQAALKGVEHKQYWPLVATYQFRQIIMELEGAKAGGATKVLIGESGCGKSYTVDVFRRAHPIATYVVVCHRFNTLSDIVNRILEAIGKKMEGTISDRLETISMELWRMYRRGEHPILILDEAENLTLNAFQMLKALFDYLKGACSICLIGTDQLTDMMDRYRKRNKQGMPQFYRRFKAGIREIRDIDQSFRDFFATHEINDRSLQAIIRNQCENYGELADYLEPALREAARRGQRLTKELFCSIYDIPVTTK